MQLCNMSSIADRDVNRAKRQKVGDDEANRPRVLHDMCNWFHLDDPAIEYHDLEEIKIISYDELHAAAEMVCKHLRHDAKDTCEFIGIGFDVSEYCVPSLMLGILNGGHAFFNVPSDTQTSREMIAALRVKYIFSRSVTSNRDGLRQFNIHGESVYLRRLTDVENGAVERTRHRFAYAVATSGSTGAPKVVRVPHPCISANIADLRRILDATNADKIAQLTNFTFDPSVVEIFLSLRCAATLFMASKPLRNEAGRLLEKIFRGKVTILQTTPSLLFHRWSAERLRMTILNENSRLRVLLLGGEPFPKLKLLSEASHPLNATRFFNVYGITEVSCWSSIAEIARDDDARECCLGEPLSETVFQVKDSNATVITRGEGVLHIGSTSRICIVGDEIAEELNERLVFRDTGDVVSIDERGGIFYRGRRNNIIKRFGSRVNLRKLEEIATGLSSIQISVAVWDGEVRKLYLCLSTTKLKAEHAKLENDIMSHLKILPAIYKPDKIVIVEQFDFTTSGKVCLKSLKRVCRNAERSIVAANEPVEMRLETLWDQHVNARNSGFLTSGGTSIAAIQISNAAADVFNVEFPELIGMLLKNVTFDECVDYVKSTLISRGCDNDAGRRIDLSSVDDEITLDTSRTVTVKPLSLNDFVPASSGTTKNHCQWYKCRGKTWCAGSEQRGRNTEYPSRDPCNIEILASYNLQKCVDASPTVYRYSESELYATVGSHSGIICTVNLSATNGESYQVKLPDRIEASVLVSADFRGIVGCYDGHVYCVHLKTGEIIWKFQTQDTVKCTAITCAEGSKVFVGSYDRHIYCLSIKDGTQIWKTRGSKGAICATGCLHARSTSVLFGTLDGSCLALRQSSGRVTWRRRLQDPIFVAPAILRTGHALFCSVAGALCCFDIETDSQMWRHVIGSNVFSYPVTQTVGSNELIVLAGHDKNLYFLETPSVTEDQPRLRSTLQLRSSIFATPWCDDGRVFVACTDGTFQAFNLEGRSLATRRFPGEIFSSPIVHDDLAVLGCRDSNLYVLRLS